MKLTITARSRDDFGVIVNSEELHKTKQSILQKTHIAPAGKIRPRCLAT